MVKEPPRDTNAITGNQPKERDSMQLTQRKRYWSLFRTGHPDLTTHAGWIFLSSGRSAFELLSLSIFTCFIVRLWTTVRNNNPTSLVRSIICFYTLECFQMP